MHISIVFSSAVPSIQANTSTYTADDMCDSPAIDYGWLDPGSLNTVDMTK